MLQSNINSLITGWRTYTNPLRIVALSLVAAMTITIAGPVAVIASADDFADTDNSADVTSSEVEDALVHTGSVLSQSDQVATSSDDDSAVVAATAGATVDIPKDASDGVTFGIQNGPKLDVTLPNAEQSSDAKQVANGVVAYSNDNGSANAVQANEDGGVRMLTVIDNPDAPTEYDYEVSVPTGGRVELTSHSGAVVLDAAGEPLAFVAAPWAKDATGKPIDTWFETDGHTLTQYVDHNVEGVVYPVTADPHFQWSWWGVTMRFNRNETRFISGLSAAVLVGFLGLSGWGGGAVAGVGYAADWAIQRSNYCLAVYKPYAYFTPGYAWAYRC